MGNSCCTRSKQLKNDIVFNPIQEMNTLNGTLATLKLKNEEITSTNIDLSVSIEDFIIKKNGKITDDYYLFSPPIGKGGFGQVYRAIHKLSGLQRAIKFISKKNLTLEEKNRLINEVNILKSIDHPNIIRVYEFFEDELQFYIVTELCTGGELFDRILESVRLNEKEVANIMKQIISAIFYCHSKNIVHRDLKPENILYESLKKDSLIKIIDFGTSRIFQPNEKMNKKYGTPYYIAPEVLKKDYNEKCDIWSCGVILYILLCGYPPFNGSSDKQIMETVSRGIFTMVGSEWETVSIEAKRFLKKLLEFEPEKRINSEQALNDPWIKHKAATKEIDKTIHINVLKNLKSFTVNNKLQDAIWIFLVNICVNSEEKAKLLDTFKSLDINGDGQLTKEELLFGYRTILNLNNPEEIQKIIDIVDINKSGSIDYSEFVMATINRKTFLSKQRLEQVFKMFDKNENGFITIENLKSIFVNSKLDDSSWKLLLQEVDLNGDGKLSLKEFIEMMNKHIN